MKDKIDEAKGTIENSLKKAFTINSDKFSTAEENKLEN